MENEDIENALNSVLLAQVREHVGKSISLYKKLVDRGVGRREARMLLTEYFVQIANSGIEDLPNKKRHK